jgi:hypothetical protein
MRDDIRALMELVKYEDEKQELLYVLHKKLFEPWPEDIINKLTSAEYQELCNLNNEKTREEQDALLYNPSCVSWDTAQETKQNLGGLLDKLRKVNLIVFLRPMLHKQIHHISMVSL